MQSLVILSNQGKFVDIFAEKKNNLIQLISAAT